MSCTEGVANEPRRRMTCWARFMRLRSGSLHVNWVLFVPLQIQSSEEGLLYTQDLASTYGDVCCWWVGPWHAAVRIFHPNCIKPVLFAPGRHPPGHSLPIAVVSTLLPTGQVTEVQIEGAVAETPISLSHLDPHPPAPPPVMSTYA